MTQNQNSPSPTSPGKTLADTPEWWTAFQPLLENHEPMQIFHDFVCMATCVLAHGSREQEYQDIAGKYAPDELNLFPYAFGNLCFERVIDPFTDTLGPVYLSLLDPDDQKTVKRRLQFPPRAMAAILAETIFGEELNRLLDKESQTVALFDPLCRSGTMLMEAARTAEQYSALSKVMVIAGSTDYLETQMTLLNLSLAEVKGTVEHRDFDFEPPKQAWQTNTQIKRVMAAPIIDLLNKSAPGGQE